MVRTSAVMSDMVEVEIDKTIYKQLNIYITFFN